MITLKRMIKIDDYSKTFDLEILNCKSWKKI